MRQGGRTMSGNDVFTKSGPWNMNTPQPAGLIGVRHDAQRYASADNQGRHACVGFDTDSSSTCLDGGPDLFFKLGGPWRAVSEKVDVPVVVNFCGHNSSPYVADAAPARAVDPALTVQEGTDIQSPGVGVAGACRCAASADSSGGAR